MTAFSKGGPAHFTHVRSIQPAELSAALDATSRARRGARRQARI